MALTWQDILQILESTPDFVLPENSDPQSHDPESGSVSTEQHIVNSLGLDVMGEYEDGSIAVFSTHHHKQRTIPNISNLDYARLLQIAGPSVRQLVLRRGEEDDTGTKVEMSEVREAIAYLAGHSPINERTQLGAGCWLGKGEDGHDTSDIVMVGPGEAAIYSSDNAPGENNWSLERIEHPRHHGHLLNFGDVEKPWYDLDRLTTYLEQASSIPWRINQISALTDVIARWDWRRPETDSRLAAALVVATWLQTTWKWRPQVAISGPSNSGKSTLFQFLENIYGDLAVKSSQSSAAGIRQAIGYSARIILCDEFENSRHRTETMAMLRNAGRGDKTFRGSAAQKKVEFILRHIAWVSAVEVNFEREPDKNRFVLLELKRPKYDQQGQLSVPSQQEAADLGMRLLAIAMRIAADARSMAAALRPHRIEGVSDRVIESYALPTSILAVVHGMSLDAAKHLLEEFLADTGEETADSRDEETLIEAILESLIHTGRETKSVAQLLDEVVNNRGDTMLAAESLAKVGMKWDELTEQDIAAYDGPLVLRPGGSCLVLSHKQVPRNLLRQTEWQGQNVQQILRRLPGVIQTRRRVGGKRSAVLLIPYKTMSPFISRDDEWSDVDPNLLDAFGDPAGGAGGNGAAGAADSAAKQQQFVAVDPETYEPIEGSDW